MSQKTAGWAWFTYALFVVYGSLVPFDFRPLPLDQAWAAFKQAPFLQLGVESRADWIANGVLYLPLGFLGARALSPSGFRVIAAIAAFSAATLLAFAVEFAQVHFPPRTVSQNDLLAEVIGSALGIVAAFGLAPWLNRFRLAWTDNAVLLKRFAWQGYALAYLLYCFFPFDILVSYQELANKLAGSNWGWLLATPADTGSLRILLLWLIEILTVLPLGFALGLGRQRSSAITLGLAAGFLLGLAIEVGQLFIASGVSQGISVFSRSIGLALGAAIGAGWQSGSLNVMRITLNRHFRWILPAYLAAVMLVSWSTHSWRGWDHAQGAWEALRLLPFYYHYYTTEAAALTSFASIVAIYAPLGVLAWARVVPPAGISFITAMLAVLIESGKLFMAGTHPDPTNVLIAIATVWLTTKALNLGDRKLTAPTRNAAAKPVSPLKQPTKHAVHPKFSWTQLSRLERRDYWLPVVIALILWQAANWPSFAWLVLPVIAASATLVWWRPAALLVLIPAAMPVFDLAPWTGRFYLDEFDLLCAATLAVVLVREKQHLRWTSFRDSSAWLILIAVLAIGALHGWGGNWRIDMNSFTNYHSPYNGLRILKGALWAWLFIVAYRSLVDGKPSRARLFHAGIAAGLAMTVLVIIVERLATVGLFDFVSEYRVTGPFSIMNKGGAYIECFLAVSAGFVIAELVTTRHRTLQWLAAALLVLTTYAVFVTYSRNGYAALAGALAIGLIITIRHHFQQRKFALPLVMIVTSIALGGSLILSGGYAGERLAATQKDLSIRTAHWEEAIQLRGNGILTSLFGMGLGRFPEAHFWSSREPRAASFRLNPGDGNTFLRLGTGATIYIEQIVPIPPGKEMALTINVRSPTDQIPKLTVTLCRKTLLTADECESAEIKGIKLANVWQTQYATFPPLKDSLHPLAALIPVKLSVMTPATGAAIDIDNVSLRIPGTGEYFTRNGSFQNGMDHWFFATDLDPPWHIHSLPVSLLFDLGWVGLITASVALGFACAGAWRSFNQNRMPGLTAFAGLVAFLISGSLNTLIDEPRFLWLWLVLIGLCILHGRDSETRR